MKRTKWSPEGYRLEVWDVEREGGTPETDMREVRIFKKKFGRKNPWAIGYLNKDLLTEELKKEMVTRAGFLIEAGKPVLISDWGSYRLRRVRIVNKDGVLRLEHLARSGWDGKWENPNNHFLSPKHIDNWNSGLKQEAPVAQKREDYP